MKNIVIGLLALYLFAGCNQDQKKISFLNMQPVFISAIAFISEFPSPVYVFSEFYNVNSAELNQLVYPAFSDDLNYSINKETLDFIKERKNQSIPKELLKGIEDEFVFSLNEKDNVVLLSEPVFIDENRFFFSITKRNSGKEKHWVFFVKKLRKMNKYQMIAAYDSERDLLYDVRPLNKETLDSL